MMNLVDALRQCDCDICEDEKSQEELIEMACIEIARMEIKKRMLLDAIEQGEGFTL